MGSRLGYAGTGTTGAPNTRAISSRPDISGVDSNRYRPKNTGIHVTIRRARTKTKVKNPII